jgi:hypothetical protein
MAILVNLKYFEKKQVSIIDVERVYQRCVSGFMSSGLTMATHAFDFMADLNIVTCQGKLLTTFQGPIHHYYPISWGGKRQP